MNPINPNSLSPLQRQRVLAEGREWLTERLRLIRFTANNMSDASIRLLIETNYPGGWSAFVQATLDGLPAKFLDFRR